MTSMQGPWSSLGQPSVLDENLARKPSAAAEFLLSRSVAVAAAAAAATPLLWASPPPHLEACLHTRCNNQEKLLSAYNLV